MINTVNTNNMYSIDSIYVSTKACTVGLCRKIEIAILEIQR